MKNTYSHMKRGTFSSMVKVGIVCTLLACLAPRAAAQDPTPSAQALMGKVAGVYKERFMSATIAPGKAPMEADEAYQAEDIVEIVPVDTEHVYVRIHLDFYNGHSCGFHGVARHENGAFGYRGQESAATSPSRCVLRVGIDKGQLSITDRLEGGVSSCQDYCGARGSLNHTIGMDRRRPIRYMERLKASRQYQEALAEMPGGSAGR